MKEAPFNGLPNRVEVHILLSSNTAQPGRHEKLFPGLGSLGRGAPI